MNVRNLYNICGYEAFFFQLLQKYDIASLNTADALSYTPTASITTALISNTAVITCTTTASTAAFAAVATATFVYFVLCLPVTSNIEHIRAVIGLSPVLDSYENRTKFPWLPSIIFKTLSNNL